MRTTTLLTGVVLWAAALPAFSQEAPAGPRPPAEIVLTPGQASAVPTKKGLAYVNGGVIDVAQPNPTTVVVTMTGLTAAEADLFCTSVAEYQFELGQNFTVAFNSKRVKSAKLLLEGRVIGLLRTAFGRQEGCLQLCKKCGSAETFPAVATVSSGRQALASLALPARAAPGCDDLSVYNHDGPFEAEIGAGCYTLNETWGFGVTHPAFHNRGASAEFAPQPAYVPASYWFNDFHPFNGAATRDFGFQVTLRVVPEFKVEETAPDTKP